MSNDNMLENSDQLRDVTFLNIRETSKNTLLDSLPCTFLLCFIYILIFGK